jgi:hypothetical protein
MPLLATEFAHKLAAWTANDYDHVVIACTELSALVPDSSAVAAEKRYTDSLACLLSEMMAVTI